MQFFWKQILCRIVLGLSVSISPIALEGASPAAPHQLNVVFHGMFAFLVFADHIEVLVPAIDDHVYKVGSWGQEQRLKQGVQYTLAGVKAGAAKITLDPSSFVVLKDVSSVDRSPSKVFCSLILPMPDQIVGLRRVKPSRQQPPFSGSAAAGIEASSFPLIETFTYQISGSGLGFGSDLQWEPEVNTHGAVNLHIFAEPEGLMTRHDPNHPFAAFNKLMGFFPGVDLRLEFATGARLDGKTNVPGLEPWEESTLRERSRLLVPRAPKKAGKGSEVDNCIGLFVEQP